MDILKTISVTVPTFKNIMVDEDLITFFKIEVTLKKKSWELHRRFSEFYKLKTDLMESSGSVIQFLKRTLFRPKTDKLLQSRRKELEEFLKSVTEQSMFLLNRVLLLFLEVDKNCPEACLNQMKYEGRITHNHFGFRDFAFSTGRELLISLNSEMRPIARFDSYITNISKSKEKKLPIGVVEVWERYEENGSHKNLYSYKLAWRNSFTSQTTSLCYSQELGLIIVGLENGSIAIFKNNSDKTGNFSTKKLILGYSKKVTGIKIQHSKKRLFSVSEDCNILTISLKSFKILSSSFI